MLQPGTVLDHDKYVIEEAIGRGGYGYVYRARERLTSETVAIKELIPVLVADPQTVQRFIQEARATLHLTHPNIARSFNVFQDGDTYYLAMEYLPGGSLADRLRAGPLPADEAVRIMGELCSALDYAHRLGVVHCDLKPANVLFDRRGGVHLADFGIAHVSGDLMTRQLLTGTGTVMGTVRYMAPEQLEGVRADPRLDLYALGVILYEMLAGRPYLDFESETTPAAQMRNMQRIQQEQPRPLNAVNPSVPAWLAAVVDGALRKSPTERYPSARALQHALRSPTPSTAQHAAMPGATAVSPSQAAVPAIPTAMPSAPAKAGPAQRVPAAGRPTRRATPGWLWALLGGAAALLVLLIIVVLVLLLAPGMGTRTPTAVAGEASATAASPTVPAVGSQRATEVVLASAPPQPTASVPPAAQTAVPSLAPPTLTPVPSTPTPVPPTRTPQPTDTPIPSPTPAGGGPGRIAFARVAIDSNGNRQIDWNDASEIYVINSDGTALQQLTADGAEAFSPAWSPDGQWIAFHSNRDGNSEVYVTSASGSGLQRLTSNRYADMGPSWSPDGSEIAFYSDRHGNSEIYSMQADGANVKRLTVHSASDRSPAWSPDGRRIAFESNRGGDYEIYLMDSDGQNQVAVTQNSVDDWWPAWSPDGSQIAYNSGSGSRARICVLEVSTLAQRCLTTTEENAASPAWSPDGRWIAFALWVTTKNCEIYRVDSAGGERVRLTNHPGWDTRPAWAP